MSSGSAENQAGPAPSAIDSASNQTRHKWLFAVALLLASFPIVYLRAFSVFAPWDDEGYLMIGVRSLLRGHKLYDEIYSQYGPFYYLSQWILYAVSGISITHESVRVFSLILRLSCASLCALTLYRLTKSLVISSFVLFAILNTLWFFAWGPSHPQEISCLLLMCIVWIAFSINDRLSGKQAYLLTTLVTALALTKINVGLYVGASLLLALLKTEPPSRLKAACFWTIAAATVVLIPAVMFPLVQMAWARNYCLLLLVSLVASLTALIGTRAALTAAWRIWQPVLAGVAVTFCLILAPFVARGTTLSAFLYMSILQHKDFARNSYYPAFFTHEGVFLGLCSVALALVWVLVIPRMRDAAGVSDLFQAFKGFLVLLSLVYLCLYLQESREFAMRFLMLLTPFSWLAVIEPQKHIHNYTSFFRLAICFLAVLLPLYGFPNSGAQIFFGMIPAIMLVALFLHDLLTTLRSAFSWLNHRPVRQLAFTGSLVVLAGLYLREDSSVIKEYRALVPLGLPGAETIRVTPDTASTYRWLTSELSKNCPNFFSMPGLFSPYFWTMKETPTMLDAGDWTGLLSASQQQRIVSDLSRFQGMCIVYNPELVEFWRRGQDLSVSPLARYIMDNFNSVEERNRYYLMVPKNSAVQRVGYR